MQIPTVLDGGTKRVARCVPAALVKSRAEEPKKLQNKLSISDCNITRQSDKSFVRHLREWDKFSLGIS